MEDELLQELENLKGRTVVDVVTGDIEGTGSFSQIAVLRLDNQKQVTIASQSFKLEKESLVSSEEGLSGLSAIYEDLDEFWDEVDEERKKG